MKHNIFALMHFIPSILHKNQICDLKPTHLIYKENIIYVMLWHQPALSLTVPAAHSSHLVAAVLSLVEEPASHSEQLAVPSEPANCPVIKLIEMLFISYKPIF